MNREQIKNIATDHYGELQKKFKHIIPGFDTEKIHLFRVEYKKLRAFLRMILKKDEKQVKLIFSAGFKKAYKISGAIRDMQLQQQRIKEVTEMEPQQPKTYIRLLQKRIDKLKPELSEIFLKNPVAKSKKKTIESLPEEFALNKFKEFIEERQAVIHAIILSTDFSDKNIHLIRKNLKDLLYNVSMPEVDENILFSKEIWNRGDVHYFDDVSEALGKFQDICTAIILLNSCRLNKLNNYNRKLLKAVKSKWMTDKAIMKNSLTNVLRTGLFKKK